MGYGHFLYAFKKNKLLKLILISILSTVMASYGTIFPSLIYADDNINYIKSTSAPKIFCEHSLNDGNGGTVTVGLVRSFYDPNASPPTDYTTLVDPGDQYALDNIKAYDNGQWYRVMSDSDNTSNGSADGYEDGLGNASSLYDNAMAAIALLHAGETALAKKIFDGFKKTIFVLFDDDTTGAAHPGGSAENPIKDQGEDLTACPGMLLAPSFDVWKEASSPNDEYFQDDEDFHLPDYPRMAPAHEYGVWLNQPENPSWAGVDDYIDSPRVSEKDDINDTDDEDLVDILPYLEDEYYHRMTTPYVLFFQWYNCDTPVTVGSASAQRIDTDKLIPYSSHWSKNEYTYKDFQPSVGDNLWMCIAMLYYTDKENDSQYLPVVYKIMDTIVENLQDFNGGVHFGYYGSHEITATATEHCIDFAFAWHWIDKLYDDGNGPVDYEHWNRYKKAMDGTITLTNNDIAILDINTGTHSTEDDKAVSGADYMLKFLAIPHTIIERAYDATSLNLPTGCDVLILPETPYQYLGSSLKAAINDFAEGGGKIFATGQSALDIGETDNPLGVEVDDMETVGGTTGGKYPIKNACRNIVISKIYKDGIDNPATAVDENLNGTFDASEANTEPTEIDNWEEGLGNLLFAYTAASPYNYILLWAYPDFKKSRLTYFISDIGDRYHALNGGVTPNLGGGDSRTTNEGNNVTVKKFGKNPTVYTANEWGHIPMMIAKVDLEGVDDWGDEYTYDDGEIEMLYFNEPSDGTNKGKTVYFVGDMFSFFYDCINHNTVDGVKFSPYKYGYYSAFSTHAQILENALQWFFTSGLDPIYTSRDPYGSNTVYEEHWAGEIGHYSATHNKFGSDTTNPGKSITSVTLDYDDNYSDLANAGDKCIKIIKDSSETYGGIWLTKNIDFGDFSSMTAGKHGGAYTGAILSGATSLTFYAKADAATNVEFGFGIEDPGNDPDKEDSDHDSISVTLGTSWTKYTIDCSENNMSHINGVFYAKITSSTGTIYIDNIHYNPRVYGYNDEAVEGVRTVYREGNNNEGIWSGWMGQYGGSSLSIDKKYTTDPYEGYYCLKFEKDNTETWAGCWVQQLGADPSEAVRWSYGEGIGANLTGATKLTFWAKCDTTTTINFGYGYGSPNDPDDSSAVDLNNQSVGTEWTKYEISLSGKDMTHINGLFYFSTSATTMTLYLDNIQYEPVGNGPVPTYQQEIEAGNVTPYIWRNKNLAHLGLTHYLENAVWADSENYLRLPPGVYEDSEYDNGYEDDYGTPLPDDIAYEMDQIITTQWPAPSNWARKKMFIRGQLDFAKATDLYTWGAAYWLDKPTPNTTNASDLLDNCEDLFTVTVYSSDAEDTNIALNCSATASSWDASNVTPDKAFDGDGGTRWTSEYSDPQWLRVDLGSTKTVSKCVLKWENATVYDDEYKIQYSDDDTNWSDAYHETNGSGQVHTVTFSPTEARYWRMYGISRAGGWGHSLWEMELYEATSVTSLEYWDIPGSDLQYAGDDFGECVWPEGIGQFIQTAYFTNRDTLAEKHIAQMDTIEYTVATGKKAYPYAWPRNMITDTAGTGWGDDDERTDSLSIAATAWMYIGKNKVECFANFVEQPDPEPGDNVALNGTATASSWVDANVVPSKAIDGLGNTRWTSEYSDPQWIRVDLGSAQDICQVILKWETAAVYDDEYKIQYSSDDTNWTDAYHETNGSGQVHTIDFEEIITARYWRMYGISRAGGWGHSLWEFEIYDVAQ